MSVTWVTVVWSMMAGAFLSLGLTHLGIWLKQPSRHVRLAVFAVSSSAVALIICEYLMLQSSTLAESDVWSRWRHVPHCLALMSVALFVKLHLRAGRNWLFCIVFGLALLTLILIFNLEPHRHVQGIDASGQLELIAGQAAARLGEPRSGVELEKLSQLLLLIFTADATVTCWSRRTVIDRRRAASVGAAFVLLALIWAAGGALAQLMEASLLTGVALLVLFFLLSYELGEEVIHADIEIGQLRTELAHLSRVTMLGELSGSLAHELNQPLAAVLSNAQAAQRFLANDEFSLAEMREILQDIVDDNKRAGEVIHGLRLLLTKGIAQHQPLDLNDLVRDVLRLVRSSALNSGIRVEIDLAAELPKVVGDRVQLQQVLLNLVVNGCDAMAGVVAADRQLNVSTEMDAAVDSVRVTVTDRGHGIAPENFERIFEPFFTSKSEGLGLGLAVSRTITTAQGGRLWASNNAERGASFHFTVPVSHERLPIATHRA